MLPKPVHRFFTALCALATGAFGHFGGPAAAQTPLPLPEKPAEHCIVYRELATGGYRLINECDYPLSVAWCSDATPAGGECGRNLGWQNARVEAKGDVPGQFEAAQAISLFACRFPKTVETLLGGSARCLSPLPTEVASVVPILPAAALKNPAAIITDSDYPASMQNKQGTTRFELTVGADGRPVSCSVTTSSGHADLDSSACKAFLRRARFSPAKDLQGNPIAGRYRGAVTWKAR
jgi:TonB family protein